MYQISSISDQQFLCTSGYGATQAYIHTEILYKPLFWAQGISKRITLLKSQIRILSQSQYFLYTRPYSVCEKVKSLIIIIILFLYFAKESANVSSATPPSTRPPFTGRRPQTFCFLDRVPLRPPPHSLPQRIQPAQAQPAVTRSPPEAGTRATRPFPHYVCLSQTRAVSTAAECT